jgi:RNA polymerase sigma-70 factor (ECF subfamily)
MEPTPPAPDIASVMLRRGILDGDPAALRAFHDAGARPLYTYCFFRLGRDHHATEEVVQETLLLALERIEEWDPSRGDLHTWLAWLSRNAIRRANDARRRFVANLPVADVVDVAAEPGGAAPSASADVSVALARLPAHYRSVLEQKYLKGESVRAIADASRTTEKSVESLLTRAREAFRVTFLGVQENAETCHD